MPCLLKAVFLQQHSTFKYVVPWTMSKFRYSLGGENQGGITCGAIDEPRKSSKAIDKHVIIDFRDKNAVIARFRDINEVFI